MDVMMRLPSSSLDVLRSKFVSSGNGNGLVLEEFVDAMLHYLPKQATEDECVKLVMELVDLYRQVDVNGDCFMSWDEFTSHCIEAGMLATRNVEKPLAVNFRLSDDFKDPLAHHVVIEFQLVEALNAILVVEANSNCVKIINATTFKLERTLNVRKEPCTMDNGVVLDDTGSPILGITYAHDLQLLVICCADMSISFWHWDDFRNLGRMQARSIRRLTYGSNSILYTTDDSGLVFMWQLRIKHFHGGPAQCICIPRGVLQGHKGMVTAFASIQVYNILATGSMDAQILLWDLESNRQKGELLKHKRAVCHLIYSKSMDLLLSAGYENDIYCWDVYNKQIVLELSGHHAPCVGLQLTYLHAEDMEEHAVSCDTNGIFKLWKLARTTSGEITAQQTFAADPSNSLYKPQFILACGPRKVLAVSREVRLYEAVSTYVQDFLPFVALFNKVLDRFYVALGKYVQVWCAINGEMIDEWYHVSDSEISCMCFDDRERKVLLGNVNGHVVVLNALNGAIMKSVTLSDIAHSTVCAEKGLGGGQIDDSSEENPLQKADYAVVSIHYNKEDKCLIAVSTRAIYVFDEDETEEKADGVLMPLFRAAIDIHEYNVTASAFSYQLSLIATGSGDRTIRIWDFQQLRLEGECVGHKGPITAMTFAEPYSVLCTADEDGNLSLWTVRPSPRPFMRVASIMCRSPRPRSDEGKLAFWLGVQAVQSRKSLEDGKDDTSDVLEPEISRSRTNHATDEADYATSSRKGFFTRRATVATSSGKGQALTASFRQAMETVAIKCMEVIPSSTGGGLMLVTGDRRGDIKEWSLGMCISDLELEPVEESKMPPNLDGYNASRHVDLSYKYLYEDLDAGLGDDDIGADMIASAELDEHRKKKIQERKDRKRKQERMREKLLRIRQNHNASSMKADARLHVLKLFFAHTEEVNSVQSIANPQAFLTCSTDGNVRIWNREGKRIGNLTMSDYEVTSIQQGIERPTIYNFNLDVHAKFQLRYDEAEELLNKVRKKFTLPRLLSRKSFSTIPRNLDLHIENQSDTYSAEVLRLGNTRVAHALASLLYEEKRRANQTATPRSESSNDTYDLSTATDSSSDDSGPSPDAMEIPETGVISSRNPELHNLAKDLQKKLPKLGKKMDNKPPKLQRLPSDKGLTATSSEGRFSPLRNSYKSYALEHERQVAANSSQARLRNMKIDTTPSDLMRKVLIEAEDKARARRKTAARLKNGADPKESHAIQEDSKDDPPPDQSTQSFRSNRCFSLPELGSSRALITNLDDLPVFKPRRVSVMDRPPRRMTDLSLRSNLSEQSSALLHDIQAKLSHVAPPSSNKPGFDESFLFEQGIGVRQLSAEACITSEDLLNRSSSDLLVDDSKMPEYRRRSVARISFVFKQHNLDLTTTSELEELEEGKHEGEANRVDDSLGDLVAANTSATQNRVHSKTVFAGGDRPSESRGTTLSAATLKSMQRRRESESAMVRTPAILLNGPNIGIYSKREVLNLKIIFDQLDANESGEVELEELMDNVERLQIDREHLAEMFDTLDKNHSGTIGFAEVLRLVFSGATFEHVRAMQEFIEATSKSAAEPAKAVMTEDDRKELSELFRLYDKDSGGTLSLVELFEVLNKREYKPRDLFGNDEDLIFTFADLERLTKKFDFTLDHELSEEDFINLMFEFQQTEVHI